MRVSCKEPGTHRHSPLDSRMLRQSWGTFRSLRTQLGPCCSLLPACAITGIDCPCSVPASWKLPEGRKGQGHGSEPGCRVVSPCLCSEPAAECTEASAHQLFLPVALLARCSAMPSRGACCCLDWSGNLGRLQPGPPHGSCPCSRSARHHHPLPGSCEALLLAGVPGVEERDRAAPWGAERLSAPL